MELITCPNCGVRVVPKTDRSCPSCRYEIAETEHTEELTKDHDNTSEDTVAPYSLAKASRLAFEMASRDNTIGMIIQHLKMRGLDEDTAEDIARRAVANTTQKHRFKGLVHMVIGGVIFLFAGVITVASITIADQSGGVIRIAWGALFVGAVEFFHGLIRLLSGSDVAD